MRIFWTDGSASPNPGPGGFAVIEDGEPVFLGREDESSNIRMEGKAMIAAIRLANGEECEIHSDSQFWIKVLTEWAPNWKKNGWQKKVGQIANLDIVKELFELYENNDVRLVWVRGHVGTEMNELADYWANQARDGKKL